MSGAAAQQASTLTCPSPAYAIMRRSRVTIRPARCPGGRDDQAIGRIAVEVAGQMRRIDRDRRGDRRQVQAGMREGAREPLFGIPAGTACAPARASRPISQAVVVETQQLARRRGRPRSRAGPGCHRARRSRAKSARKCRVEGSAVKHSARRIELGRDRRGQVEIGWHDRAVPACSRTRWPAPWLARAAATRRRPRPRLVIATASIAPLDTWSTQLEARGP